MLRALNRPKMARTIRPIATSSSSGLLRAEASPCPSSDPDSGSGSSWPSPALRRALSGSSCRDQLVGVGPCPSCWCSCHCSAGCGVFAGSASWRPTKSRTLCSPCRRERPQMRPGGVPKTARRWDGHRELGDVLPAIEYCELGPQVVGEGARGQRARPVCRRPRPRRGGRAWPRDGRGAGPAAPPAKPRRADHRLLSVVGRGRPWVEGRVAAQTRRLSARRSRDKVAAG
jgi:hypothetical protein